MNTKVVFFALFIFLGMDNTLCQPDYINDSFKAKKSAHKREWLHASFTKKYSVNLSDHLYMPSRGLYVSDNHLIYITDIGDNTINLFDEEGNFIRAFAKRKGAGPGEVRHPIGFAVDDSGNIWIADPGNARVAVFKQDGSFVKDILSSILPYRIALGRNHGSFYILDLNAQPKGLFTKISSKSKILGEFGAHIIKNQMRNSIVLSGEITTDRNGNLYYKPDYAGVLISYDSTGHVRFRSNTVINTPFPKVKFDAAGGSWVDRDAKRVSHGIFTDGNGEVVIFSFASSKSEKQALDFYNEKTGTYLYSLKIPVWAYQAYFKDNMLYTLQFINSKIKLTTWNVTMKK
jgi:hypothetical protein